MQLIDSHAHLDGERFGAPGELEGVLTRARAAGVGHIVLIGQFDGRPGQRGMDAAHDALRLAERDRAFFSATAGIHPHEAAAATEAHLEELRALCAQPGICAVGECGLDYHYDHSPREVQRDRFARQLQLARSLGKPVVVHSREADGDTAALLKQHLGPEGGVIHCFTSDWPAASAYLDLGMSISLSGVVTFKTAEALRDAAVRIPLERLLIETDAPFLAPVPFRGKRNEPAYVRKTAERLAELKGVSLEALAEATTANARRALRLPAP